MNGWPCMIAFFAALSCNMNSALRPDVTTIGVAIDRPIRPQAESDRNNDFFRNSARRQAGTQSCASRAINASSSFCESFAVAERGFSMPSGGASLIVSPLAILRCGFALVEQRPHLARIELRLVLRLRRLLWRCDFRVGLLRIRLLLLGLLGGGVLLERFGDQVALRLRLALGGLLGLRRRRRLRGIGRRGDLFRRDLRVRIVDRRSAVDFLRERILRFLRVGLPARTSLLAVSVTMLTAMLSTCGRRQPRRRKAHQRRAEDDDMTARGYGPVRPQRPTFCPAPE